MPIFQFAVKDKMSEMSIGNQFYILIPKIVATCEKKLYEIAHIFLSKHRAPVVGSARI